MPAPADLDISWLTKFVRDQLTQNQLAPQAQARVANHVADQLTVNNTLVLDGARQPKFTTSVFSGGPPRVAHDGDIWSATGMGGLGERWQFQYDVNDTSHWKFIGGPPCTFVSNGSPGSVAADSAWHSVGSGFTTSRAGVYSFSTSITIQDTLAHAITSIGLMQNGTAVVALAAGNNTDAVSEYLNMVFVNAPVNCNAGDTWNIMLSANGGGTMTVQNLTASVVPVRIS